MLRIKEADRVQRSGVNVASCCGESKVGGVLRKDSGTEQSEYRFVGRGLGGTRRSG